MKTKKQSTNSNLSKTKIEIMPPGMPTKTSTLEHWVLWVDDAWRDTAKSVIETGNRMARLYEKFREKGQKVVARKLKMPVPMTSKLISIGMNRVLVEFSHGENSKQLPTAWTTLYLISQIKEDELREKLKSGVINPDTKRKEIEEMLNRDPKPKKSSPNVWEKFSRKVIDKYCSEVTKEVKSSASFTEKEYGYAEESIDAFIGQLEELKKTLKGLSLTPPDLKVTKHVKPRGKQRRTK